jgi:urease gamma subunit
VAAHILSTLTPVSVELPQVLEFIREGKSVAELMDLGRQLLGK